VEGAIAKVQSMGDRGAAVRRRVVKLRERHEAARRSAVKFAVGAVGGTSNLDVRGLGLPIASVRGRHTISSGTTRVRATPAGASGLVSGEDRPVRRNGSDGETKTSYVQVDGLRRRRRRFTATDERLRARSP